MEGDLELINNIKSRNDKSEESAKELSERHAGVYFKVVNKFTSHPSFPNFSGITRNDLEEERGSLIYDAALHFKEEKGVQFNTFLGNHVKYYLYGKYNSLKHEIFFGDDDDYLEVEGDEDINIDEIDKKLAVDKIFETLESLDDKRIIKIFKIRYQNKLKLKTWKQVSKEMDYEVTYETCRSLHNRGVKLLREKLKKELFF